MSVYIYFSHLSIQSTLALVRQVQGGEEYCIVSMCWVSGRSDLQSGLGWLGLSAPCGLLWVSIWHNIAAKTPKESIKSSKQCIY